MNFFPSSLQECLGLVWVWFVLVPGVPSGIFWGTQGGLEKPRLLLTAGPAQVTATGPGDIPDPGITLRNHDWYQSGYFHQDISINQDICIIQDISINRDICINQNISINQDISIRI